MSTDTYEKTNTWSGSSEQAQAKHDAAGSPCVEFCCAGRLVLVTVIKAGPLKQKQGETEAELRSALVLARQGCSSTYTLARVR